MITTLAALLSITTAEAGTITVSSGVTSSLILSVQATLITCYDTATRQRRLFNSNYEYRDSSGNCRSVMEEHTPPKVSPGTDKYTNEDLIGLLALNGSTVSTPEEDDVLFGSATYAVGTALSFTKGVSAGSYLAAAYDDVDLDGALDLVVVLVETTGSTTANFQVAVAYNAFSVTPTAKTSIVTSGSLTNGSVSSSLASWKVSALTTSTYGKVTSSKPKGVAFKIKYIAAL